MAKLNPYLSFKSEAKDALDFYRSVLGGELTVSTFGENPMEGTPRGVFAARCRNA